MRINVKFQPSEEIRSSFSSNDEVYHPYFGEFASSGTNDYSDLINKPQINSIVLEGNLTAADLGLGRVYYDTKENWDAQLSLIAEKGAIYVYSNYQTIYDEVGNPIFIAGVKIGDGKAYLIDIPFVTDAMTSALLQHITNTTVHITAAEREFWNNKVSSFIGDDIENLVLSKTMYEKDGELHSF